jgi:hypothetical protein
MNPDQKTPDLIIYFPLLASRGVLEQFRIHSLGSQEIITFEDISQFRVLSVPVTYWLQVFSKAIAHSEIPTVMSLCSFRQFDNFIPQAQKVYFLGLAFMGLSVLNAGTEREQILKRLLDSLENFPDGILNHAGLEFVKSLKDSMRVCSNLILLGKADGQQTLIPDIIKYVASMLVQRNYPSVVTDIISYYLISCI